MTCVVAIDFECAGGVPSENGFTQMGAVIMRVHDQHIISKFNSYANMSMYKWEDRCMREFWSRPDMAQRYKETIQEVEACKLSPYDVVEQFWSWLDENCAGLDDVYMITDNCAFDGGILKYFSTRDTLYAFRTKWAREIVDVCGVYMGMSGLPVDVPLLDTNAKKLALDRLNQMRQGQEPLKLPDFTDTVTHDHHPVNDATVMALYWCFFQNEIAKVQLKSH